MTRKIVGNRLDELKYTFHLKFLKNLIFFELYENISKKVKNSFFFGFPQKEDGDEI